MFSMTFPCAQGYAEVTLRERKGLSVREKGLDI
jgi:hypothetical protein